MGVFKSQQQAIKTTMLFQGASCEPLMFLFVVGWWDGCSRANSRQERQPCSFKGLHVSHCCSYLLQGGGMGRFKSQQQTRKKTMLS